MIFFLLISEAFPKLQFLEDKQSLSSNLEFMGKKRASDHFFESFS
jgi:hypothetical protein